MRPQRPQMPNLIGRANVPLVGWTFWSLQPVDALSLNLQAGPLHNSCKIETERATLHGLPIAQDPVCQSINFPAVPS